MRILVWNMGAGSPGASSGHDPAWEYLRERDDYDVALLQETREPPAWVHGDGGSYVWQAKYAGRGRKATWGCAVVARTSALTPYEPGDEQPWLRARSGSTAIGQVDSDPTWFASVHLHSRSIPNDVVAEWGLGGIEITTPDRSVWETNVIPHELQQVFGTDTFVWGGDFNADPRMDDIRGFTGGNRRAFECYGEAGSLDARARFHREYQQTYFKAGRRPYQLDHVFVDRVTEGRLTGWEVDPSPATKPQPLSDHAPILMTLD